MVFQTIYTGMVVNESDIRAMVTECVNRILEVHGAIDDKLEGLARLIIKKVRDGEDKFTLSKEEIDKYYPYGNRPNSLNVLRCNLPPRVTAAYNFATNTIKIRTSAIMFNDDYLTEILMHELTHFVNGTESNNSSFQNENPMGEDEMEKVAKTIIYLFDPSEMSARISQFKQALKYRNIGLKNLESVTRLSEMKKLIQMVELDELLYTDEWTLVEILLYTRAQRKTNLDNKPRELNTTYENFEKAKEAIVKKLKRAYKKYYAKICKIYYDMKNDG